MKKVDMNYIKDKNYNERVIRTEILFTPILVIVPICVGLLFILDWYIRGFIDGGVGFEGNLILGLLIIIGNIMFDFPFIKSLRALTRIKK
jgi:hypothetical protein